MEIVKTLNSLVCGVCLALSVVSGSQANPGGATVVHGSVSFSQPNSHTLNITNTPGAIVNWQQFGINQGEITRFIQQGANSAILNRIVGQDPSRILGQLNSNGKVFLVNPNGIVFGKNSMVNTAGLIASTLNISNQDFINGNMRFADLQNAAEILNQGFISASNGGEVVFVAPKISNEGTISVENGSIVLAAGQAVTINSLNYDNIEFEVQAPDNEAVNLGEMITDGGSIGVFAGSITNKGRVSANAVTVDDAGNIVFVAQTDTVVQDGTVTATSETGKGGYIEITGDRVGLFGETSVDASGATGGGEVLIGGDLQGKNPEVKNATATFVDSASSIKADAKSTGDGGKVIVWADDTASIHGAISATGGSISGNGGFVETSGKQTLSVTSTPDVTAVNGSGGEWLIDPNNITIVAGSGFVGINNANPFLSTADSSTLGVFLITEALSGGANVTITTGSGGGELGDITLGTVLELDNTVGTNTLTLSAHNDINIDFAIQDTITGGQTLNLVLNADSDATGGGIVAINANIDTGNGSIALIGSDVVINNAITAGTNDVIIQSSDGGDIAIGNAVADMSIDFLELSRITANNLSFKGTTNVVDTTIIVEDLNPSPSTLETSTPNISGTITLDASNIGGGVIFQGTEQVRFDTALTVLSDSAGILVDAGTVGVSGGLRSNGDLVLNAGSGALTFYRQD